MKEITYRDLMIRDLSQLNRWRFSVQQAAEELKTLDAEFTALKATSFDKIPGGGGNTQEEKLITVIAKKDQRSAELKLNRRRIADMERMLAQLSKEERSIIERMVVNGEKADSVAHFLGYETRHVYRKRDAALAHLCQLRHGAAFRP